MSDRRQLRRRCDSDCQDHIFNFKKIGTASKYDYQDSFCPKYQRDPQVPQHTLPIFNNDGRYYTAGFIPGVDIRQLEKNLQQELMSHQKLVKDSMQKPTQIKFPRPNPKHTKLPTCSVCKVMCTNYYEHIRSIEHHENIVNNLYNQFLLQLCQNYREFWDGCQEKADAENERISEAGQENDQDEENSNFNLSGQQDQQQENDYENLSANQNGYERNISRKRPPLPLLCDVIKKKIKIDYGESLQIITFKSQDDDEEDMGQSSVEKGYQKEKQILPEQSKIEQKINQKQEPQSKNQENQKQKQHHPEEQGEFMEDLKGDKQHKTGQTNQNEANLEKNAIKQFKKQQKQQKYYLRHKSGEQRQKRYNYRDSNYQYPSLPKYYKNDHHTSKPKNQSISQDQKTNKYNSPTKYLKHHEPSNLQPYPQYLKKMQKQKQEEQNKTRQGPKFDEEKHQDIYNTRSNSMMYGMYNHPSSQQWNPSSYQQQQQSYYYPNQTTMGSSSQQPRKNKNNHPNSNTHSHSPSQMNHSYVGNTSININFPLYISPSNYPMNMYRGYPHPYNMQYPYQSHAPPSYQYPEYPGKHYQSDRKDDKK